MVRCAAIQRVIEDEMAHTLRVECCVIPMPMASSSPAQQGHSLDAQMLSDPLDDGNNVSHDLRRARQRWVLCRRLFHFWWSGGISITASINHIDDMSVARQVSSK